MFTLSLALLGPPQIWLDGRLLTFESRKAVALLAYLAMTGEAHSRASLAALFWPESDQKRARGALRYTLSILRRQLGDGWLHVERQTIAWQPTADFQLDVADFQAMVAKWLVHDLEEMSQPMLAHCREELETAVSLYRDDFMAGFSLRDCPDFDEWHFFQTEKWRRVFSQVLQTLLNLYEQQSEWEAALPYARRWLQLDQLHEPAHQALMRGYAHSGQWSAALRQYESCVAVLERELGIAPTAETTALYEQIRQGRPGVEPAATAAALSPQVDRAAQILLDKVNHFWVEGVLEQSSPPGGFVPLTITPYPQAVAHPWQDVLGTAVAEPAIPSLPDCLAYYQESNGSLLILGAAGAGKTLSLIQLARDLIETRIATGPLPIILNLSTWAESQTAIGDWVVEELITKYQIPHKFGRQWLEAGRLILLLDGLDELPETQRPHCITAINQLREQQGLNSIVVCCRQLAYEQTNHKLNLNRAVLIQPLDKKQIVSSLESLAAPPALLTFLDQHEAILEMSQSPLTLSILTAAYDVELERALTLTGPVATQTAAQTTTAVSQQLFTAYVRHMFQRRRQPDDRDQQQAVTQLTWLARQMQAHNQTIFLVESIQPSWLPTEYWRWFYMLFSRIVGGIAFGFVTWLFILIGQDRTSELEVHTLTWISKTFYLPTLGNHLLTILLLNMGLGMIIGLLDGLLFRHRGDTAVISRRIGWQHLITVSITAFLITTLFITLFDPLPLALFAGLLQGTGFIFAFGYLARGQSFRTEVRPVEALGWSWTTAVRGLGPGLLFGSFSGYLMATLYTPFIGKAFFWGSLVIFSMFGGLQRGRLSTTARPNQGIWLSAQNGAIAAITFAVVMTGTFWLVEKSWPGWYQGLLFGSIAGLIYGGSDVLRHLTLRAILWYTGHIPWRFVHFLDFAVSRILLRRVGGGYIFRHRLLQEYFSMKADKSAAL